MGKIMPPVDINDASLMGEFKKRVQSGPLTLVFVYADWCGHCQNYKKTFEQLENNKNRTVQIARLRDDVVEKANIANAKIEAYPTVILVNNKNEALTFETENGTKTNDIPDSRNVDKMNLIVENAGKNGSVASVPQPEPTQQNVETSIPNSLSRSSYPNTMKPVEVPEESLDLEPTNSLIYKSRPSKLQSGGCGCTLQSGGALQSGGSGLYGLLTSVAMKTLPAIALLGLAQHRSIPKTKKKSRKIRKTLKKKRSQRR
jgi:thiol-disulfide isomerase/thioredoxin